MLIRENPESIRVVKHLSVHYEDYIAWQTERVEKRKKNKAGDAISVITFSDSIYTTPDDGNPATVDIEATIVAANRGGGDGWHGPGQVTICPVVKLMDGFHIRDAMDLLEAPVRRLLREYGVTPDEHDEDEYMPGVQVGGKRIAHVALHLDELVTSYGIALNVDCDLSNFDGMVPCGIENCEMTNLAIEADRPVELEEVFDLLCSYFEEVFLQEQDVPGEPPGDQDGGEPLPDPNE